MKIFDKAMPRAALIMLAGLLISGCDDLGETITGSGSDSSGSESSSGSASTAKSSTDGASAPAEATYAANQTVKLDSFTDFDCTSNWANRDGALGLKVGSARGSCQTPFPGTTGIYKIELLAQTEREGRSPYQISINRTKVASGKFPFSQGKVNCKCYRQPWAKYCPDVVRNLDAGTHLINTGDVIEYYGEEEYLCGKHGAYSKWKGLVFKPVN